MNNVSTKSLFEVCAFLPLVLLALAGCYKFGYLHFFDASWLLPSLNVQGFIYSILGISLIFLAGVALSSIYFIASAFCSYWGPSLVLIATPVVSILVFVDSEIIDFLMSKCVPFILGFFYYMSLKDVFSGDEFSSMLRIPAILALTFFALFMMALQGNSDAYDRVTNKNFPVVELGSAEDSSKDWRLLETSGSNLILINLNSLSTKSGYVHYEIKFVEANKVDLVY